MGIEINMYLTLHQYDDVTPEFHEVPISRVQFDMLKDKAQKVVIAVGFGVLISPRREFYSRIYPPKENEG